MIIKTPTLDIPREQWLAQRRKSLGGSDMGAVLGLNKWASPYSVWADKTGRLPEKEDTEAMRQGRDLEEYIVSRFNELSGKKAVRYNYLLRNDDAPYLHANIDRRIYGEKSGLECKVTSALNLKAYHDGQFPEPYYAQCVSYLAVTGWERWYLAVLIAGREFRVYLLTTIHNDPLPPWCEDSVYVSAEEIEALKSAAARFWTEFVESDTPPPVDGTDATGNALAVVYAESVNETAALPFGRESMLEEYCSIQAQRKALDLELERIKQTLQQDMQEAEKASAGEYTVTWKPQVKRSFDAKCFAKEHPEMQLDSYWKEITSRVMRIRKESTK